MCLAAHTMRVVDALGFSPAAPRCKLSHGVLVLGVRGWAGVWACGCGRGCACVCVCVCACVFFGLCVCLCWWLWVGVLCDFLRLGSAGLLSRGVGLTFFLWVTRLPNFSRGWGCASGDSGT